MGDQQNDAQGNQNGAQGNGQQNDAQGNNQNGAQGNGFDQDKFFEKLGQEFTKFQTEAQKQGGQQNSGQQQQQANQNNSDLATKIDALPETLVNAFKEAFTPPQQQGQQGGGQQNDAGSNNDQHQEPGKKPFIERWFN